MKKIDKKIISSLWSEVVVNPLQSFVKWCIDSRFRQYKRLDKFLQEQVNNPSQTMLELAYNFYEQYRTNDERIIAIRNYVINNFDYMTDLDNYGMREKWQNVIITNHLKSGDCDDLNSFVYVLARLSGIPKEYLFCVIGDTMHGGHFWVVYYSNTQYRVYPIDATYYKTLKEIKYMQEYKYEKEKYINEWYIFNESLILKWIKGGLNDLWRYKL